MPRKSIYKNKVLTLQIEDTRGVAKPDAPTNVLLTEECAVEVLQGETVELQQDTKGSNSRATPIQQLTQQNVFSFKTALTAPVAAQVPVWVDVFRACGFNVIETDETYEFRHAPIDEQDSCTVRIYQEADMTSDHLYVGTGGTGNLSLEFEAGQKPYLTVSNLITNYVRPDLAPAFNPDHGEQLSNVCESMSYTGTNVAQLDGTDLCIKKLEIQGADGRDLALDQFFCGDMVTGKEKPVRMKVTFINPDWGAEIHPWEISEAHEQIQRVPFLFDHDTMKVLVEEVQPINTTIVELGQAGLKGLEMELNVLSSLELSVKKGV